MSDLAVSPGRPANSLHFIVGEMNGKMDQILASVLPQITGLDSRVTAIEYKQTLMTGAVSVIIFIVTAWEVIRYVFISSE